jgi:hypothetical protein
MIKMHPLDIFSDSPKLFIFQKQTNKTNFGGILTLIFSLIMIFISLLYFLDYNDLNDYSIEYSHIPNLTLDKDIPKLNNNPDYNPNITFALEITNLNGEPLSERFLIYDFAINRFLDRSKNYTIINRRISDFHIKILYYCENESNCILKEKDISKYGYKLKISFNTAKIDLQNHPTPIIKDVLITKYLQIPFYFKYAYNINYDWEVIKYIEQNTLLDRFRKKKEEFSGQFSDTTTYIIDDEEKINNFKILLEVNFRNLHSSYIQFKRKRKTLLDLVAKITSLFQTLYFGFRFAFKYYSKNFNNYKIIEKVLDLNNKNFREIEISHAIYEPTKISYNYSVNNKNNNLDYPLINNSNKNNNLIINDDIIDCNNNIEIDDLLKEKVFPKLSFMHFFCNNLYYNKCNKFRSQEFLHICNKILLKYISIDSILYNQMRLENLFKDYNWNNPILNNIEKNDLINKLKTLI